MSKLRPSHSSREQSVHRTSRASPQRQQQCILRLAQCRTGCWPARLEQTWPCVAPQSAGCSRYCSRLMSRSTPACSSLCHTACVQVSRATPGCAPQAARLLRCQRRRARTTRWLWVQAQAQQGAPRSSPWSGYSSSRFAWRQGRTLLAKACLPALRSLAVQGA